MGNMRLSPNFYISEFMCHDGTNVPYDLVENVIELAKNLQILRDHLNHPIKITSGYRNPTYNKQIGGEDNSFHCKAMAADIQIKGFKPKEVYALIENLIAEKKMEQGGLGLYNTFVHYDIRGKKARW